MLSMYAKLFSRIAQSSLMEQPVNVRYCFMMLLALCDVNGDVIGTDVAIARMVNLTTDDFKTCVAALMGPDPDSNSPIEDGRRVIMSPNGRGYHLVNYTAYRSIKTDEEKRAYMREYMRKRRNSQKINDVTDVNVCKTPLVKVTQAEGEVEAEVDSKESPSIPAKRAPRGESGITEGKDSERVPTTEQSKRFATIFHRRHSTAWSEKEIAAYRKIGTVSPEDMAAIEAYYEQERKKGDEGRHRRDLQTFLNNFQGELDRANQTKIPKVNGETAKYRIVA